MSCEAKRCRVRFSLFVLLLAMAAVRPQAAGATALDDYVAAPDPAYRWEQVAVIEGEQLTGFVLDLKSQTWRLPEEVNRTLWQHWLVLLVPEQIAHSTALLFIGGGDNTDRVPARMDPMLAQFAAATNTVVAELRQIPNQPLVFAGETEGREEDSLIAYAWEQFRQTGDPLWAPRLPMSKAAVRAMDAIQEYMKAAHDVAIKDFVVAGGSKRGWTTWTTAAVDKRVRAICPVVIDVLNVRPSMEHHRAAYGFWAPAIGDYVAMRLMDWMDTPEFDALMALVDPYSYRKRYTMPKFILNSAGDQFFLPDSSQFYFKDLPGEKYLRYVPNSNHGLGGTDAPESLLTWYAAILEGRPRPKFSWTKRIETNQATFRVKPQTRPLRVNLWQATNPEARDFRLESLGSKWVSSPLEANARGNYVAQVEGPPQGWTACFVELVFDSGQQGIPPFKFSTDVAVVPDTLPFAETH